MLAVNIARLPIKKKSGVDQYCTPNEPGFSYTLSFVIVHRNTTT